jgi:hypothetical protein
LQAARALGRDMLQPVIYTSVQMLKKSEPCHNPATFFGLRWAAGVGESYRKLNQRPRFRLAADLA